MGSDQVEESEVPSLNYVFRITLWRFEKVAHQDDDFTILNLELCERCTYFVKGPLDLAGPEDGENVSISELWWAVCRYREQNNHFN